jgi:glycosyltransferase involved in cell wall biosynthesis
MKILFISMPSIHVIRWIENLKETDFELYWFDILNRGKLETIDRVTQFTEWKKRKVPYIKGEYTVSKNLPQIYNKFLPFLEVTISKQLESILLKVSPDIVHSFEMQSCSYPILKTMNKFKSLKWIYSCWGSDLYYFDNQIEHKKKIRDVLQRINYIHTDCLRDQKKAVELGYKGKFYEVIPGGGGYDLSLYSSYISPFNEKNIILIKGYQHKFGRALKVLEALNNMKDQLKDYQVIVFGAHQSVIEYIKKKKGDFLIYDRNHFLHLELMKLMGKSLIFIGNSISDGLPNTLLEAIIMGAFPIQSNPGGASAEIIKNGDNGFLIENPEDSNEIQKLIENALSDKIRLEKAFNQNKIIAQEQLDYSKNKNKIIQIYRSLNEDFITK